MQLSTLHQHLVKGLLPSLRNEGQWEKYVPDEGQVAAVIDKLRVAISSARTPIGPLDSTATWLDLSRDLEGFEKTWAQKDNLADIEQLVRNSLNQAESALITALNELENKQRLGRHDFEQLTKAVNLLIQSHSEEYFPLPWIEKRASVDREFYCNIYSNRCSDLFKAYFGRINPSFEAIRATKWRDLQALERVLGLHPEFVQALFDDEGNSFTLLHLAVQSHFEKGISYLIKLEASVDALNNAFCLPLEPDPLDSTWGERPKDMLPESLGAFAKDHEVVKAFNVAWQQPTGFVKNNDAFPAIILSQILNYLKDESKWVEEHPNFVAIMLCHAVKHIYPASEVNSLLKHYANIITDTRAANILHEAIESGRVDIVRQLLDLGVDPTLRYQSPLIKKSSVGHTPLEQAIYSHRLNVADFLLQCGCTMDVHHVAEVLRNSQASNNTWRWLLNVVPDRALEQQRLDLAIENKQWGEVTHWIKKGLVPADVNKLALSALRANQLYLVEQLWDLKLLEKITDKQLEAIITVHDESWPLEFLRKLILAGVDVAKPHLVATALKRGRIPLAAMLVKMGAPTASLDSDERQKIEVFANQLSGSEAEQTFRAQLTEKNLAHLVGDSFVRKMRDDRGEKLEGNLPSASINFLTSALRYAFQKRSQDTRSLEKVIESSRIYALRIVDIARLSTPEEAADALADFEADLLKDIGRLSVGQSLMIPTGWLGHATAMVCKKLDDQTIEIQWINTGEGVKYHESAHDRARQHSNTINRYHISLDRLQQTHLLQALIEPTATEMLKSLQKNRHGPDDVYQILLPFKIGERILLEDSFKGWKKLQLSGTCSLRCLLVYLKSELSNDDYKALTDVLKEDSVSFAVQQYEPYLLSSHMLSKFFAIATPHLFDTFGKRLKQRHAPLPEDYSRLSALQDIDNRLKAAKAPSGSIQKPLSLAPSFPVKLRDVSVVETSSLNVSKDFYLPNSSAKARPEFIPLALSEIKSPQDLINALASTNTFVADLNERKENSAPYITTTLSVLGREFMGTEGQTPNFVDLLNQLKQDPIACQKVIEQIVAIAEQLSLSTPNSLNEVDPRRYLAVNLALGTTFVLSTMVEEALNYPPEMSMKHYGINNSHIAHCLYYYMCHHSLLNSQWEKDYQILQKFDWKVSKTPLFQFRNHHLSAGFEQSWSGGPPTPIYHLRMQATDSEYQYVVACNQHSDWTQADKELEESLEQARKKSQKEPHVDPVDWRIHWAYTNDLLPSHFVQVRNLAAMACQYKLAEAAPHPHVLKYYRPSKLQLISTNFVMDQKKVMQPLYGSQIFVPNKRILDVFPKQYSALAKKLEINSQNRAITQEKDLIWRELGSIRFEATMSQPYNGLAPMLLMDYYSKNLDQLASFDHQLYFEITFFCPTRLPMGLKDYPDLADECNTFFVNAIQYYEDKISTAIDKQASAEAAIFLTTQYARLLSYANRPDQALEIRKKLQSMLSDPDYQSERAQHYLHLALLDSTQGFAISTFEEAELLIKSRATLTLHNLMDKESAVVSNTFLASCSDALYSHAEPLCRLLQTNPDRASTLLNQICALNKFDVPDHAEWNLSSFPIASCIVDKGTYIEINWLTGLVLKNGTALSQTPYWITSTPLYQHCFGDSKKLPVNCFKIEIEGKQVTLAHAQDEHGPIEMDLDKQSKNHEIRRRIGDHWFSFVEPKNRPPIPPFAQSEKWSAWRSIDGPNQHLFVDTHFAPQLYIDHDGHYIVPSQPDKKYEWVDLQNVPGSQAILAIDSKAYLLQEVTAGKPESMRIILPNIKGGGGESLELNRTKPIGLDEEKWVVKGLPHLFLSQDQTLPGITNFTNFLILESSSGSREALIPVKSKKSLEAAAAVAAPVHRVKVDASQLSSQDPEKNAYLAYLSITHATGPEDYQQAMKFLQKARKFERYSAEELRLLGSVFLSQHETKDHTGYAYACRLHVAWLIHDNLQRNPQPNLPSSEGPWPTFESDGSAWEQFWTGSRNNRKQGQLKSFDALLTNVARKYFEYLPHLPHDMRIEAMISARELQEWGLDKRAYPISTLKPKKVARPASKPIEKPYSLLHDIRHQRPHKGDLVTRPQDSLHSNFTVLWDYALSKDPAKHQVVNDVIRNLRQDTNSEVYFLTTLLSAALHKDQSEEAAKIVKLANKGITSFARMNDASNKILSDRVQRYGLQMAYPEGYEARLLRQESLTFDSPINPTISRFERLLDQAFVCDDAGNYQLSGKVPFDKLTTTHLAAITKQAEHYENNIVAPLENRILEIAKPLKLNDCIALFANADERAYQKATNLESSDIANLHQLIGEYIIRHHQLERHQDVALQLGKLQEADSNQIQQFAKALASTNDSMSIIEGYLNSFFLRNGPKITPASILPESTPLALPAKIPTSKQLPFKPSTENSDHLEKLFKTAFEPALVANEELAPEPFIFNTEEPWLQASIEELNAELEEGTRKNNQMATYQLTGKVSYQDLITTQLTKISNQIAQFDLKGAEEAVLNLANRLPSDPLEAIKQQTVLSARRVQPLNIRDCIGLFLLADEQAYRTATKLENAEDIAQLHQLIGDYIVEHNKVQRHQSILKVLNRMRKKELADPSLLQTLAQELSLKPAHNQEDPNALIVFEYGLNLVLHQHQVDGIRDMTEVDPMNPLRLRSKLLQRIQGGGKSLVFGHIMALLKADGYHLSIHVPPTAQYQTTLYDMALRSDRIFGQRERTLVFDDDPMRFTTKYLSSMQSMMQEAIVNREYITITSESLRAMRCKYLKTRFLLRNMPEGPEKISLRASNAILKQMLFIMRSRGIFTFDEMHLAFDPIKELNMPYGDATHLDVQQNYLISKILRFACAARDAKGHPCLDIKHSSEQTTEQRATMKAYILERLSQEPGEWNNKDILAYISGVTESLPDMLRGENNRNDAKLVILARQMLTGKWLEERLQKNVMEDHGLEENSFPRVSIPSWLT